MPRIPAFDRARQWRALAIRQAIAAGEDVAHELAGRADDDLPQPDAEAISERLGGLETNPPLEADPEAFRRAIELLRRHGPPAVRKLVAGDELSGEDGLSLEALIYADGSRPSLLLAEGLPPTDHPLLGAAGDEISANRFFVRPVAQAVGRIQPGGGGAQRYAGTGILVAGADGPRVLTNHHVVAELRSRFGVAMDKDGAAWRVRDLVEIDFAGEFGRPDSQLFTIVEACEPAGAGSIFAGVDLAVLKLSVPDGCDLPAPAQLSADAALVEPGVSSFCTIGFPGPPPRLLGVAQGIDWGKVVTDLFGGADRFGFKRLAPGGRAASHPADLRHIAFGHDCTTLGGASGSPIVAWGVSGTVTFGLHFAGATGQSNQAVALGRVRAELEAAGVRFAEG